MKQVLSHPQSRCSRHTAARWHCVRVAETGVVSSAGHQQRRHLAGRVRRHDAGVYAVNGAPVGHPHDHHANLFIVDSLRVRVSITITPTDGKAQIHTTTLGA